MSGAAAEPGGDTAPSAVEQADRRFGEQLMADALYLRAFIAGRGLYSKEVLDANKALMTSIEKAEASSGALTADTENALLEAMGNVLRHLKCNTIEDLRRADSPRFRLALLAGRIVVFTAMFGCIILALPLTLAFNQVTALTSEINAALSKEALSKYLAAQSDFGRAYTEYQQLTEPANPAPPEEVKTRIAGIEEKLNVLSAEIDLQRFGWPDAHSLSPILQPLLRLMETTRNTATEDAERDNQELIKKSFNEEVAELNTRLTPIRRNSEALAFLLNQGVLPLLYGMLGAAVFLSRRYMATSSELWASNPLADALMRIGLGGMAGLIVGWFQTPDVSKLTTTPFALAFVAGFSIDIVFSLLERIVAAFDFRKAA